MFSRCAVAMLLLAAAVPATARGAECAQNKAGAPMATGKGNVTQKESAGLSRLFAERAAFLDALGELRKCMGEKASTVTGWTVSEVRYFDSDPVVEVDVAGTFDAAPQVTALGSGIPDVEKIKAQGGNVASARLTTKQSAVNAAKRNAKEALDALWPASGASGAAKQEISGMLGGCVVGDIAYWDDHAVSVKVTCGRGVVSKGDPEGHKAPPVGKHK